MIVLFVITRYQYQPYQSYLLFVFVQNQINCECFTMITIQNGWFLIWRLDGVPSVKSRSSDCLCLWMSVSHRLESHSARIRSISSLEPTRGRQMISGGVNECARNSKLSLPAGQPERDGIPFLGKQNGNHNAKESRIEMECSE